MSDWLDDPAPTTPVQPSTPVEEAPPTALQSVAARIAAVSPDWAQVTAAPDGETKADTDTDALGRDRAQGLEAIREGWLLHRGGSRVAVAASPDLSLLVGDWCYAAGLCLVADHGTLDDVAQLANLVADVSARATESTDELQPRWDDALEALRRG